MLSFIGEYSYCGSGSERKQADSDKWLLSGEKNDQPREVIAEQRAVRVPVASNSHFVSLCAFKHCAATFPSSHRRRACLRPSTPGWSAVQVSRLCPLPPHLPQEKTNGRLGRPAGPRTFAHWLSLILVPKCLYTTSWISLVDVVDASSINLGTSALRKRR